MSTGTNKKSPRPHHPPHRTHRSLMKPRSNPTTQPDKLRRAISSQPNRINPSHSATIRQQQPLKSLTTTNTSLNITLNIPNSINNLPRAHIRLRNLLLRTTPTSRSSLLITLKASQSRMARQSQTSTITTTQTALSLILMSAISPSSVASKRNCNRTERSNTINTNMCMRSEGGQETFLIAFHILFIIPSNILMHFNC